MSKNLKEFDLVKIYNKWAEGLGPFRCFLRATNFVSLKHYPDFQLNDIELTEGESFKILKDIIDKYDINTTLYFVDIPAAQGIKLGFYIQKLLNMKPVLIFNNPLHPYGIVGDKDYISRLISYGELLEKTELSGYAFILDNYRYKECSDDELKYYFNNQYELTEDDLPYHYMLEELGFKRVVYIYKDDIKEDIAYYLEYLKENNIEVEYKGVNLLVDK